MKITFLGTGTSQGVPPIGCTAPVCYSLDFRDKRKRSSIYIQVDNQHIVIDTGPDFRQQMLEHQVERVDGIFYTHEHQDHVAGLDDVRGFNFMQEQDIPVYATNQVIERLRSAFEYIFANNYPGVPQLQINMINEEPFKFNGVPVTPLPVMHGNLPVLGFRIYDFVYLTDVNNISPEVMKKIKGCRVLVLDALQHTRHYSHYTLKEAIEVAREVGAEKTYFTHISYKMGFHRDVNKSLPENMRLAFDGLKLEL
jgi:phosphoribosyl 1,2-cyclic phosphate phosphodiesterase